MAYPINDGSILECTIQSSLFDQTCLSVFHYRLESSLGLPDGDAAINAFNLEWNDLTDFVGAYAGACSEELNILNLVYQWVTPIRYHRVFKTPVALNGEVVDGSEPSNTSQVITRTSDQADRHGVGTTHVPALPKGGWASGYILAGQKTKLDLLAGFMTHKYNTNTMVPVLFNRKNPASSRLITQAVSQQTVRVMRRRTVGVGI